MPEKKLDTQFILRMNTKERKALEKEAESEGRALANYIRYLLDTHPKREKNKNK